MFNKLFILSATVVFLIPFVASAYGGGGVWLGTGAIVAPSVVSAPVPAPKPAGQVLGVSTFRFNNNMSIYLNNRLSPDVTKLQERLTEEGVYNGPITGFFGPLTRAAVIRYQEKYGITPAVGYVGPITREVLNDSTRQQQTAAASNTLTSVQRANIQAQINMLMELVERLRNMTSFL